MKKARFHLPGLFEFHELYRRFLPLFRDHREWFYDWCEIASVYGSPADCLWEGGRFENGTVEPEKVLKLLREHGVSACLTFSNSLLREEHLKDRKCNALCRLFSEDKDTHNGVIVHSELLLQYLEKNYPDLYFVSSTTKVITSFSVFRDELNREDFRYVVPDFRLNRSLKELNDLSPEEKSKTEFLVNECCWMGCRERKACYENVSRRNLGEASEEHACNAPGAERGYRFSEAMKSSAFISVSDIRDVYLPMGFSDFKIEGRGLGSAIVLEFLLYYLVRPEHQLEVRENVYLDNMLDLF